MCPNWFQLGKLALFVFQELQHIQLSMCLFRIFVPSDISSNEDAAFSNDDSQSLKEWAIIEVQGDLESSTGDSIGGKLIGHLIYSAKGRPILIIGYHILYGKIVENNPPLAILKRSRSSHALSSDPTYNDKVSSTEYTVLALVKKKITFRTRPKPIISVCH
ncbi:Chromosome transmission fidelity protein 8 [Araneus ventricosus]|uniref:Chromosome transmission fidelity protein 8 n=1 Tax=Araneus ventricosus TaxID=182803 RepID=A0A4Y2DWN5_ARAVE|nr:Chromosome transmission fidelity protein 8 [Araneus ventricosus]